VSQVVFIQNNFYQNLWKQWTVLYFLLVYVDNLRVLLFHQLKRVGPQHQAGSDARLTGQAFFTMRHVSHYRCAVFGVMSQIQRQLIVECNAVVIQRAKLCSAASKKPVQHILTLQCKMMKFLFSLAKYKYAPKAQKLINFLIPKADCVIILIIVLSMTTAIH